MQETLDESYRRAALLLAEAARDGRYSSVLFTSATTGEGTTTTVLGVARQLKESHGKNPLVVELNDRRPVLAEMLSLDTARTCSATGAIAQKIQHTTDGLAVLTASSLFDTGSPVRPAAILERVLNSIGSDIDVVLVDTPPVLEDAGTLEAGSVVPRVILVVEAGRTRSEVLDRAKAQLETRRIAIVGAVLSKHRTYIPNWLYRWI